MPFNLALRLTIRQRFFIVMLFFISSLIVVGIISFMDLVRIRDLSLLVGEVQQLNNMMLETRRFEKNYLLYGNIDDLKQADNYLDNARVLVADIASKRDKPDVRYALTTLRENLNDYEANLERIFQGFKNGRTPSKEEVSNIRSYGNSMVSLAESLTVSESKRILSIIDTLKMQLIMSVMAALALLVIMFTMMFGSLFSALSIIQTATRRIAQGIFEPLPEVGGQSDANSIIKALNSMVRELELRQTQLLQAQKLSSIGTLTAGIAHQLNNPLNNISTSSQILLEDGPVDAEFSNKLLHNIEGETQRAREIVKGLLEFSRERDFSLVQENLLPVVEKTVRLVSSQIPGNVRLSVDIPEHIKLYLDSRHFQEALLNLIINAVHAMSPNPGAIVVKAGYDGGEVFISVTDTGPGIPKDIRDRIFDPFFTTKGDIDGTGLGLSIVYGIVKKHGGRIAVEGGPEGGVSFIIHLPLNGPGERKDNDR